MTLKELKKDKGPKEWSLESRTVSIEKTYLRGELKGSTMAESAPQLPAGYTKTAKAVAEKQAALGRSRLAEELQKFMR